MDAVYELHPIPSVFIWIGGRCWGRSEAHEYFITLHIPLVLFSNAWIHFSLLF